MLTKSGVKLLDFGLARLSSPAAAGAASAEDIADDGRARLRHGPLHGARTGARRGSRRTHRSVCVRRSVLRNADGTAGIQRRLRAGAHRGHPRAGSSSPHQPTAASTSGARASGERVSGEGSGRTLAAYAGPPAGSSRHRRRPHAGGFSTTSRVLDILRSHWPREVHPIVEAARGLGGRGSAGGPVGVVARFSTERTWTGGQSTSGHCAHGLAAGRPRLRSAYPGCGRNQCRRRQRCACANLGR